MSNINKNIIKQAGAAVANATNKAAGLPASTPEPGSIISAIQLVNGGREIGPAALAHFTESVRNKLLSLLVSLEPIQDLNGYAHPWPAGGGENILPMPITSGSYANGVTVAVNPDLSFVINKSINSGWTVFQLGSFSLAAGTYTLIETDDGSQNASMSILHEDGTEITNTRYTKRRVFTLSSAETVSATYSRAASATDVLTKIMLFAGDAKTADDYSPYSNICPISGRTRLSVYVGPTSAIGDAATYLMDWTSPAGTVYAGSADIVTGDIKAAPYYESYNGETLVGPWVSSMDEYDPEGTPTTGAQVVDLGGTMTEYHITGKDVITLVGDNYIWSDSGDVTITE